MKSAAAKILLRKQKPDAYTLEIFGPYLRLSAWSIDVAARILSLREAKLHLLPDDSYGNLLAGIRTLCEEITLVPTVPLYVITDHRHATTTLAGVTMMRTETGQEKGIANEISRPELQELISKALWKLFSAARPRAAKKMNTPDIHLELLSADLYELKLDKHRVSDPIGFQARSVELWARLTMVRKQLTTDLRRLLGNDQRIIWMEFTGYAASAITSLKKSSTDKTQQAFVSVGARTTALYKIRGNAVQYSDTMNWGANILTRSIQDNLAVTPEIARELIRRYEERQLSPAVRRKISDILGQELAVLLKGIDAYCRRSKSDSVYISSWDLLPTLIAKPSFQKKIAVKVPITSVEKKFIGENYGYQVKLNGHSKSQFEFDCVALTLASEYSAQQKSELHDLVKKSTRLLSSN
ncbi:MAG: hypothetical protein COU11_04015 [Candidatus Harrisonbacteria bacterium CG10_big_fil_rev_8_21_14_0_10_49_15]|uniref:Uncharacterized protein n=1 Tax=Candidatus Harrisonbacteria bacterium CG10_big_fil_rev_8_21_14_0_10_49_15 TaxID=1974587 RepID=A0A2H0UJU0_9BACT|nr:MAG: hypothetical protein COU11_04015 [Candidatus Harrisonbacteria bacterium CG10_big_fil_rev_8_21_14_0_10_49_15]